MKTLKLITTSLFVLGTTFLVAETLPVNGVPSVKEYDALKTKKMLQMKERTKLNKKDGSGQGNSDGLIKEKNKYKYKEMSGSKQGKNR